MTDTVDASPTKDFFVNMITKDIALEDAVLDLLDNSIDGARSVAASQARGNDANSDPGGRALANFWAEISLNSSEFSIKDNCGGISLANAAAYAFHFGRRPDAPSGVDGAIGLYGIGMKRAVLKMGKAISVRSSTESEAFEVLINVDDWLQRPTEWDFPLERNDETWDEAGTIVNVRELNENTAREFGNEVFTNRLREIIARDYSFIINDDGFRISLNGQEISPYGFALRESEEIKPAFIRYVETVDGVEVVVQIAAGMADVPPDDSTPDSADKYARRHTGYYGWFVVCNNRVVLAADKTDRTVWGDDFPSWHSQYNGFMGIVRFTSSKPGELPWTTTKRDVDESNPIYRRAVTKMKEATREWTNYTNRRKSNAAQAKQYEQRAVAKPIRELSTRTKMLLPSIAAEPRIKLVYIQYQKPETEVNKVRDALGNRNLANTDVGRLTFEYFVENEEID